MQHSPVIYIIASVYVSRVWHAGRALWELREKWQTSVFAYKVAVHTIGVVLERAISMERVTMPI